MPTVLICDDDAAIRFALGEALSVLPVDVVSVATGQEAIAQAGDADVLITDLVMPEMDGFAVLGAIKKVEPELPVIMLTARGSERVAVQALKEGAYDYLTKPFGIDELRVSVTRALEARALRRSACELAAARVLGKPFVGQSPAFRHVLRDAQRVGRRDVTVLVRGETGTGKELLASVLHAASSRHRGPCVRFNCAALSENLAEAELFGHERGAFTGATSARPGYFRQAHGGTLVLDEVGELPLPIQGKLLRVLQEREVQPLGASRPVTVDVRVVACTHRDLRADVTAGRFREDLLYRLAVVELTMPPLRERASDIPLLTEVFRQRYAARFDLTDVTFAPVLLSALASRPWPGNVRELENAVARLLALAEPGSVLDERALGVLEEHKGGPSSSMARATADASTFRQQMSAFERGVIERALEETGGNQSEAARRLGISRMTLIEKMKRHGVR